MSGYLARLVDRAAGTAGATVVPRLGPLYPLGPAARQEGPGTGRNPAGAAPPLAPLRDEETRATVEQPPVDAAAGADRPGPGRPPDPPHRSVAPVRSEPVRARGPSLDRVPDRPPDAAVAAGAPVSGRRLPVSADAELMSGRPDVVATPTDGERDVPEVRVPVRVETRARPTRDDLPARRSPPAAADRAPRIEVRIGRVEVRRPPEPEAVQWPAPAPQQNGASGFDGLAAARRYVDRRWS